jgi:hypothetical protein
VPALALDAPAASASREHHADWLELRALQAADRNSSLEDLIAVLRASGTAEALAQGESGPQVSDRGSEIVQATAEGAFSELDDRVTSCGAGCAYPFVLGDQSLEVREDGERSVYTFLLLLSLAGYKAGPPGVKPTELFEEISGHAAQRYLGGDGVTGAYQFGFPRRTKPKGFRRALDDLCGQLGEGTGSRSSPTSTRQKDGKLDIALWRPFPDGREGKLMAFGQCATGKHWADKKFELQPQPFCSKWMLAQPTVLPVRLLFVPDRVSRVDWRDVCYDAGILFDRCRLAAYTEQLSDSSQAMCETYCRDVIGGEL